MGRKNAEALGAVTSLRGHPAVTVIGESNLLESGLLYWWEHSTSQARTGAFSSPLRVKGRKGGW